MFCTKCGKEMPDGSVFCGGCGTSQQSSQNTTSPNYEFRTVKFPSAEDQGRAISNFYKSIGFEVVDTSVAMLQDGLSYDAWEGKTSAKHTEFTMLKMQRDKNHRHYKEMVAAEEGILALENEVTFVSGLSAVEAVTRGSLAFPKNCNEWIKKNKKSKSPKVFWVMGTQAKLWAVVTVAFVITCPITVLILIGSYTKHKKNKRAAQNEDRLQFESERTKYENLVRTAHEAYNLCRKVLG